MRGDSGQSLVLGALVALALAAAAVSVARVGEAAHARISLQDATDAAAQQLAADQARVFNFFALTNRAMIVHYHAMLGLLAHASYALYLDHTLGRLLGLLAPIPLVGEITEVLRQTLGALVRAADAAAIALVPALGALNYAGFLFQAGAWLAFQKRLADPESLVRALEPRARAGPRDVLGIGAYAANLAAAARALDVAQMARLVPGHPDFDNLLTPEPEGAEARLVMTELVNAARDAFVAGTPAGDGPRLLGRAWEVGWEGSLGPFGDARVSLAKTGRTELGPRTGGGLQRHDQLFSEDALVLSFRLDFLGTVTAIRGAYRVAVAADRLSGFHREGFQLQVRCPEPIEAGCEGVAAEVFQPVLDAIDETAGRLAGGGHHFFFGITPFAKFDPSPDPGRGFGQPDVVVVATLPDPHAPAPPLPRREGAGPAYRAAARARTEYHRPGEWREHPNFFNPFWSARLVPLADHPLARDLGLDGPAGALLLH